MAGSRSTKSRFPSGNDIRGRDDNIRRRSTSRVARLAHVLDGIGIGGGSRVAYLGSNHPAFLESLFATATLGAIFVPLNVRLSAAEIDFMLGRLRRGGALLRW